MSGARYEWTGDPQADPLAALEDPAEISFEIIGRNGAVFGVSYTVKLGQRARIVSQLENHDHVPDPAELEQSTRVDTAVPEYLLMVYGIECVPDGAEFPDQPGEPDD